MSPRSGVNTFPAGARDREVLSVASRMACGETSTPTARVLPCGQR